MDSQKGAAIGAREDGRMRRFEFVQGTSAKFWMATAQGVDFHRGLRSAGH